MTIYYPDVYSGDAGISFTGALIAMVKATEGTGYTNPDYTPAKGRAAAAGSFFCAYHFLHQGNAAAQARRNGLFPLPAQVVLAGHPGRAVA